MRPAILPACFSRGRLSRRLVLRASRRRGTGARDLALAPALLMVSDGRPFVWRYGLPRGELSGRLCWAAAVGLGFTHAADAGASRLQRLLLWKYRSARVRASSSSPSSGESFSWWWASSKNFCCAATPSSPCLARLGFWPTAIILSSPSAPCTWNKGESLVGAAGAALIGLFFCLTLRRTGNLWFAVGLHASWDWGETYLYSVPNSGGRARPPARFLIPGFPLAYRRIGRTRGQRAGIRGHCRDVDRVRPAYRVAKYPKAERDRNSGAPVLGL